MGTHRTTPTLPLAALAASLLHLSCGGGDSTGPVAVASIQVTPAAPSLLVGETVQLEATLRDAGGNVLTGRSVSWRSDADGVVAVNAGGLATGSAAGDARITAAAGGREGSTVVTVTPVLTVTSITPAVLVEGERGTITGEDFSAVATENRVTVDGVAATVTAASPTSLEFVVPVAGCRPARNAVVRVATSTRASRPADHPLRPARFLDLAVGRQSRLTVPGEFCLQFASSTQSEAYLVGLQSVADAVSSLTPAVLGAEAGAPSSPLAAGVAPAWTLDRRSRRELASPADDARAARWNAHRASEARLREWERSWFQPMFGRAGRRARPPAGAALALASAVPAVGDVVAMKVPDRETNSCTSFAAIDAVVRHVGARSIWLEDTANPAGGFTAADYASLGARFDDGIYATDVDYFGEPTDLDANERILVVVTKEVNEPQDALGFVAIADFYPDECPASNGGEVYYAIAPDANGTVGFEYSREDALLDAPILIAHELAHIIQVSRRLSYPGATSLATTWEMEGQATLAEEVNAHRESGRAPGANYGADVAVEDRYFGTFADLALYYGFETRTSRVEGAPEQCSWLGREAEGNEGPCLAGREVYGVPAMLLRWISDHFGPAFPDGERGLHRALIDNEYSGFATIADVTGAPIDELLAQWAASLYVDDRVAGADARLTVPSWNLFDIESAIVPSGRLTPMTRVFEGFQAPISVRAGSTAYFVVSGTGRPATAIGARGAGGGVLPPHMRLWVVRLR